MEFIQADWPAPNRIQAGVTTRRYGHSRGAFDSFNLGAHVGDDDDHVCANRHDLFEQLSLPQHPIWLNQTHGVDVVDAANASPGITADASFTTDSNVVCAVLTADCLPILLCDREGTCVAAVHAGWRGLVAGIIEATIKALTVAPSTIMAWLGPAIGPQAFEVGDDVRAAFCAKDHAAAASFTGKQNGRWHANLYELAEQRLRRQGIQSIYGGDWCTVTDLDRFYSYRRDGKTGRMASLIWMQSLKG